MESIVIGLSPEGIKKRFEYNDTVYLLYDGKVVNPPFFNEIIITRDNLTPDDLKMIYNMLNMNGRIFFIPKYRYFYDKFCDDTSFAEQHFRGFQKKTNFQYIFEQPYRTVEFLVIGAQKAGTTALSLNISKHPDIYIDNNKDPRKSEIHFFDIYWKKGIEFYKKKFNYAKKRVGEKTPDLLYLSYTFPLIQSVNPFVKLIVVLRNPIERAYSSWKLVTKYFGETRSFKDAITDEIKNKLNENKTFYSAQTHYLQRGLYFKQLTELYKWFPKHNVLILVSENVKKNMSREYNKVYDFLNLPLLQNAKYDLEFESEDTSTIDEKIYNKLIKFYAKDVEKLEKLLDMQFDWFNH
jgi:hypothetical protein